MIYSMGFFRVFLKGGDDEQHKSAYEFLKGSSRILVTGHSMEIFLPNNSQLHLFPGKL